MFNPTLLEIEMIQREERLGRVSPRMNLLAERPGRKPGSVRRRLASRLASLAVRLDAEGAALACRVVEG